MDQLPTKVLLNILLKKGEGEGEGEEGGGGGGGRRKREGNHLNNTQMTPTSHSHTLYDSTCKKMLTVTEFGGLVI